MQRYGALAIDLVGVALTPFVALLIRDNLTFYEPHWQAITGYAAISFVVLTGALLIGGSHKALWQYTSLPDVLKIIAIMTVALVLAVAISFLESRLEGVARSVPVIQWFLLVGAVVGTRIAFRVWHERARRDRQVGAGALLQHVLVVGVNPLTELYLESVAEHACKTVTIVGILSDQTELGGRRLRQQKILGRIEELPELIDRLEVHGITIERVAVMEPFERLSPRAAEVLLDVEQGSAVQVDWIVERLGLNSARLPKNDGTNDGTHHDPCVQGPSRGHSSMAEHDVVLSLGKYGYAKRGFDIVVALLLSAFLAPLILVVALLVMADLGLPVVFWQQRPGRFGRPFKLFKFCTMRPAHDRLGKRIPDEKRTSTVGELLRKTRLDELPQLYNVLIGEMSFVGPRPLLPIDQPEELISRLSVRPGLTGFAQVHGGRHISAEDKNTLDVWYIRHASLWFDVKIMLRTVMVLIWGERIDQDTLNAVRHGLERLTMSDGANSGPYMLLSSRVGSGKNEVTRSAG
jgi:lipopolysaccharide/colanic/teichoic acid biosynthesis glycosyltransferase